MLVNEAGELDIDSHFLSARALNASIGLPSLSVAGGCACCSVSSDLAASLRALQVTTGGYSRWRWHCKGQAGCAQSTAPTAPFSGLGYFQCYWLLTIWPVFTSFLVPLRYFRAPGVGWRTRLQMAGRIAAGARFFWPGCPFEAEGSTGTVGSLYSLSAILVARVSAFGGMDSKYGPVGLIRLLWYVEARVRSQLFCLKTPSGS